MFGEGWIAPGEIPTHPNLIPITCGKTHTHTYTQKKKIKIKKKKECKYIIIIINERWKYTLEYRSL